MLLLNIIFSVLLVRTYVNCEVDVGIQTTLLNGFVYGLNNLPDKAYIYDNGVIKDAQKEGDKVYKIQVDLRATDIANVESVKQLQCSATLQLTDDGSVGINSHHCDDLIPSSDVVSVPSTTPSEVIEHKPLQLDNELSTDTAVTSGEQFVAVPKDHCIGCSSHVDIDAPGVIDLAALAIKHIDIHEPDVKHELNHVIDVQRQVQIVNGVRYIFELSVDYTNSSLESDTVAGGESNSGLKYNKICSISILEKPWAKLPDGSKYRAILANNCTADWLFGDDGEVISLHETNDDNKTNGEIKQVHIEGLSSNPKTERVLTVDEIKALQEQIIPHNSVIPAVHVPKILLSNEIPTPGLDVKNAQELHSGTYYTTSEISNNKDSNSLTEDKKKSIDALMNIFDFSGFDPMGHRSKRSTSTLLGGPVEKDVNNEKYKLLAEKSLDKYISTSGGTGNYKIINIEKVTEQVVSGSLTKIIFNIAESDNTIRKCSSSIWEQPWLNNTDITVKCDVVSQTRIEKQKVLGGSQEQNPNDSTYKLLAEESLKKYVATSGNGRHFQIVRVDKVTVQVVAGLLTKIDFTVGSGQQVAKCHSEVFEQKWLNVKDIKIECDFGSNRRLERSNNALGAKYPVDLKDPNVISLAEKSMNKFLKDSGKKQKYRVVAITKAEQQVVDGFLTKLEFKIQPSDNSGVSLCHSTVIEGISKDSQLSIDVKCNDLLGGVVEQDVTQPKYQSLAQESLNKYTENSKLTQTLNVISVDRVTEQLVAGTITRIDFTVGFGQQVAKCHSEVFEQKWLNVKDITVECDFGSNQTRIKREMVLGGLTEKNPNDSTYKLLAAESFKKYVATSGNGRDFQIVSVDKVTEQVVAGTLTKIDFTVGSGQQVAKCHSEVLEQKWLNVKDIKIECDFGSNRRLERSNNALGAKYPVDLKDPNAISLAEKSMNKFLKDSGKKQKYRVVAITKAEQQVVDGFLTKLEFKIQPSDNSGVSLCHSTVIEGISKDSQLSIDVKCNDLLGGVVEQDVTQPKYQSLAQESLNKYTENSKLTQTLNVISVDRVIEQLVAGTLTKIDFTVGSGQQVAKCHSEVFEQKWLNVKDITVECDFDSNQTRMKRGVIPGGLEDKNPNDSTYKLLAEESLKKCVATSGNGRDFQIVSVDKVTEQVVAGLLTRIDFTVGAGQQVAKCHSEVLEQKWLNVKDITVECDFGKHKVTKRNVHYARNEELLHPETLHTSQLDSETAADFANEALKHIEAKYPHPRKQAIVKIFSATQAIVAGKHYKLKVEVGVTNCTALSSQENCQLETDSDSRFNKFCKVNIWVKSNTEHPPRFHVTCDDQSGNSSEVYHHIQAERLFYDFLTTYQPSYLHDQREMFKRFNVFKDNIRKIHELNIYERGTAKYAVTKFADLTYEEFSRKHLGLKPGLRNMNYVPMREAVIPDTEIPNHFDWRDKGAVTEVKNQGSCGSCWAFSVTGNIEGQWKLKSGKLVSLSEQELVDCDKLDQGCNGGLPDNAYRAIEQLGGLETESDYPYDGSDDKCAFKKSLSRVSINGAVNISSDEQDMAKWLVNHGPISIGINANAMQFYMGGVSHPWKVLCNASNLDHGVLIVGYGAKDYPLFKKHLPYWTIKNSWGPSWGEQGYYRVFRGDGTCGVNKMASSAVIT